jgi:hypothetical protein
VKASPALLRATSALLGQHGRVIESRVQGASMGRTLPAGTAIRVRCTPGAECRTGDIVAFLADTTPIVHRVVGRGAQGRYLLTRGDGTWMCDPPVAEDLIVGVVAEWNDGAIWRSASELPVPAPSPRAERFQSVLMRALNVHVWAARGVYSCAYLAGRLLATAGRLPRARLGAIS